MGAGFLFSIPAHERIIHPGYISAWQATIRILLAGIVRQKSVKRQASPGTPGVEPRNYSGVPSGPGFPFTRNSR